jgi:hypothetical protein
MSPAACEVGEVPQESHPVPAPMTAAPGMSREAVLLREVGPGLRLYSVDVAPGSGELRRNYPQELGKLPSEKVRQTGLE